MEEINSIEFTPKFPVYTKTDKLNLDLLRKEQLHNKFCKNKVKPDPSFILDENSILIKAVKLKYSVEPAIVLPRKLTNTIIHKYHDGQDHQGISLTINMIRRYSW